VSDEELVSLHREVQQALVAGVTPHSTRLQIRLEKALCRELDLDVFDHDMLEHMFDAVHEMVFEDAATRPARLVIEGWGAGSA
jgi:hypothetical protein